VKLHPLRGVIRPRRAITFKDCAVAARRDDSVIHKTQRDAPLSREAPT